VTEAPDRPDRGGIELVGADLVEVSPRLDPSGRTPVLAAKMLREFLIAYGAGTGNTGNGEV